MKAIWADYEHGEIKPVDPPPEVELAGMWVLFADTRSFSDKLHPWAVEEDRFACGRDSRAKGIDGTLPQMWAARTR